MDIRHIILLFGLFFGAAAAMTGATASAGQSRLHDVEIIRQADGGHASLADIIPDLARNRILFVGEMHDRPAHHQVQLEVVRALHESGRKVAVGMEMFRKDSQRELDRWVAGETSPEAFQEIYYDNWNYPWELYGDVLMYARENRIPVVGLNVAKGITRQVAMRGFQSLSIQQREALPMVSCHVDDRYMKFVRDSFGLHGHGHLDFTHFCEAQLVWDKAMAVHALSYVYDRPDVLMIVVTGKGHAQKMGIPAQIRKRSALPMDVMLPQPPEALIPGTGDAENADYLYRLP